MSKGKKRKDQDIENQKLVIIDEREIHSAARRIERHGIGIIRTLEKLFTGLIGKKQND